MASVLRSLKEAIDDVQQLPAGPPDENRARMRALALLWAAHDERDATRPLAHYRRR
jgi:hypothetical protein